MSGGDTALTWFSITTYAHGDSQSANRPMQPTAESGG